MEVEVLDVEADDRVEGEDEVAVVDEVDSGVKWSVGSSEVDREFVQYVTVSVFIFITLAVSLFNLTLQDKEHEMWSSILSMMIGVMVPNPKYPKRDAHYGH